MSHIASTTVMAFSFFFFGGFQVELDGKPVTAFESNKVRALLAYLAVEAGLRNLPQPRSTLAGLLWPDHPEDLARTNLRHVLRQLRQSLPTDPNEPPLLLTSQQTIQLNPDRPYLLDVTRFTELIAQAEQCDHRQLEACPACVACYSEAATRYRGEFLAGLAVQDSDLFENWVMGQREALHRQALEIFFLLAAYHEGAHNFDQARHFAWRQIELEPWREEAHRQLMRLLARSGQRTAALAQFAQCRATLAEELGVEPDPETLALYEQIRAGELGRESEYATEPASGKTEPSTPPSRESEDVTLTLFQDLPVAPAALPNALLRVYAAEPTLFVARERELARLDEYWQRAQRGRGQMIFVTGEAGSGKTALLQAFVGRTQNAHADLIAAGGACAAQIGIGDPYLPFRDLLNLLTGALETRSPSEILTQESATRLWHLMPVALASLVEVAPDLVDHLVPSTALLARARLLAAKGTGWLERLQTRLLRLRARAEGLVLPQTRIFAQVTDLLHNLATRHPLLLVLEDLHWADTSSLSLLFHLSRMLEQRRILIIGTYRPEEVSHGWEGKPHPLQTVLSECKRQFGDIWVDLAQVSEQSGRQFVDAFLDSEPNRLDEAFRAALFQRTEGHPLFTIELLRDLQARGDLQQDGAGRWTIARNLDWATVPARVEGVIEKRIERLTPAMRQALSAASVEGEEFTAEVVAGVQSVPERELVRQLGQEVDRQHQLVSAQNLLRVGARSLSRYRFRHNLFQQYLYQSLGSAERTYLHEAIAKMLESLYGEQTEQVAAQLAHHFAAAEIIDKAVDYLFQAGEKARFLSANSEAIKHFRYGLALLATLPDTPERAERELALQVPLGSVLSAVRGYAATEVGETFNRAYTLCQQLHNNSQLFSVLHGLHHFYYNRGEWQRARAVGEEMVNLANANQDPLLYAEAHQALSIVLFHLGKFDLALRQAEQGVAAYDRTQQQAYLRLYGQDPGMVCLSYAAQALWCLGYFDQARQRIEEAIRIGEELAHPFTLTRALNFLAILNHFAGDAEGTLAATEARSALIRKYGFQHYLGGTQVMRGWALSELGRGEVNEMQQGLATMHAGGSIIGRHYFLSTIAVAYANNGQVADGLRILDEAVAAIPLSGHFWEAEVFRLKGALLLMLDATDQTGEAERALQQGIALARQQGGRGLELRAMVTLGQLWQRQGKTALARQELLAIYRWYHEGFGSADLRRAQDLLAALGETVTANPSGAPPPPVAVRPAEQLIPPSVAERARDSKAVSTTQTPNTRRQRLQDWGEAPTATYFYGRQSEVDLLKQWLLDERRRLVMVLGMGGMGKTTLVAKAAKMLADEFDFVFWRSVLNAPPLTALLQECLRFLSQEQLTNLPGSLNEQFALLFELLRQHRCLLVLDNVESILEAGQAGHYRPGYEGYGQLLERMSQSMHQSCLVLTSRERPQGTLRLAEDTGQVTMLPLLGLGEVAGRALLKTRGVADEAVLVDSVIQRYSGNPLALKLVARTIQELFEGDITTFLSDEAPIFDDIRLVLDQQFQRLSPLERDILVWLAVERAGLSLHELAQDLVQPPARRDLLEGLRALQRRSLLEKSEGGFALQNVVTEYITDYLVDQICREIEGDDIVQPQAVGQNTASATHPLARLALNRYALLKAQAKEFVRHSQTRLILQPIAERLVQQLGRPRLMEKVRLILARLRNDAPHEPGYAAGNLLNLLLYLNVDVSGFDFSQLAVWQAYLRDATLRQVNFCVADLRNSVFSEVFGALRSLAVSGNGQLFAAGTEDDEVRLWSLDNRQPYALLKGYSNDIRAVAFSPEGDLLASGGENQIVCLWDVESRTVRALLAGHTSWVWSVAFSPDGATLASGSADATVRLWDVRAARDKGGRVEAMGAPLRGHSDWVCAVAFSPNGRWFASGSKDFTIRLWHLTDRLVATPQAGETAKAASTLYGHTNGVTTVTFSPNGDVLASGSEDTTIRLWDLTALHTLCCLEGHTDVVTSVAFRPASAGDSALRTAGLVSGSRDGTVRIWDLDSRQVRHTLCGHTSAVTGVAFTPDGATVISSGLDQSVRIWDPYTGQALYTLNGYTNIIISLAFSHDGRLLASGSSDHTVCVWQVEAGQLLHTLQGHRDRVKAVAFSPDGATLASSSLDQTVRTWQLTSGRLLQSHSSQNNWTGSIVFTPAGQLIAGGSADETVHVWDPRRGTMLHILREHASLVKSVAFSSDGQVLASGSWDQTVCIWELRPSEEGAVHLAPRYKLYGHQSPIESLAIGAGGPGGARLVASGGWDHAVHVWTIGENQPAESESRHVLQGHTGGVLAVAFAPPNQTDGYSPLLASASDDGTIRLWASQTGELLHILRGHEQAVTALAFSPDGSLLASGSADQTIRCWEVATGVCRQTLRTTARFAGMEITGTTGITDAQRATLKALGAVERR